jgi:hypothetical protein
MRKMVMKRYLILAGGWFLTAVGAILTPIPMPLPFPFPIGITMLLVGLSILTTHSKPFRRAVQYVRHHNGWLSRGLETVARWTSTAVHQTVRRLTHRRDGKLSRGFAKAATRSCEVMTNMVDRTSPHAHGRKARMQSRKNPV